MPEIFFANNRCNASLIHPHTTAIQTWQSVNGSKPLSNKLCRGAYVSKAGCSRSLTHRQGNMRRPALRSASKARGSAVLRRDKSSARKISGVDRPMGGLTSSKGVSRGSAAAAHSPPPPPLRHHTMYYFTWRCARREDLDGGRHG